MRRTTLHCTPRAQTPTPQDNVYCASVYHHDVKLPRAWDRRRTPAYEATLRNVLRPGCSERLNPSPHPSSERGGTAPWEEVHGGQGRGHAAWGLPGPPGAQQGQRPSPSEVWPAPDSALPEAHCYIILYYVMLCYVVLCYVMLCYNIIYYVVLYHVILRKLELRQASAFSMHSRNIRGILLFQGPRLPCDPYFLPPFSPGVRSAVEADAATQNSSSS